MAPGRYRIISAKHPGELETQVNNLADKGYMLHSTFAVPGSDPSATFAGNSGTFYAVMEQDKDNPGPRLRTDTLPGG